LGRAAQSGKGKHGVSGASQSFWSELSRDVRRPSRRQAPTLRSRLDSCSCPYDTRVYLPRYRSSVLKVERLISRFVLGYKLASSIMENVQKRNDLNPRRPAVSYIPRRCRSAYYSGAVRKKEAPRSQKSSRFGGGRSTRRKKTPYW
jgi:hypothetical protein